MSAILKRVQRMLLIVVAGVFGLSLFAPMVALGAYTSGDTAVISTGGGDATIRSGPSTSSDAIGSLPDGTEVFILEGPITGDDGSSWYQAGVWDITGYISASLLADAPAQDTAADTTSNDSSSTIPWKDPIDYGVVVDNTASPLPADGLACRTDADSNAEVIIRFGQGETIEVTGQEIWIDGVAFLPVNCGAQGGYVKFDYIALQSEQVADEPVVQDEPVADEPVAEEAEAPAQEEEAAPVAGDLIVTVVDQNGQAVAGACFDLYDTAGWVASACDSNDTVPNNGNSGFFGLTEGSYTLVATSAPEGISIANQEAWVSAGQTSYATVNVTTASAPAEEATDEPVVTEEPAATDEVVTEESAVTDEAAVTEEPAATEEPATNVPSTEEPAVTEEATEVPATDEATEAPATEETTPVATLDVSGALGDATVTGTNGEGVRCRVAPDVNAATITVLAEGATVFVLENPTNGFLGVACANQLGYADVNYMWAGGAGDEIPASASSVVVVGTGGARLNCRAGAGSSYSVVTSVAMGTVLTTRGASSNGWAPVVCNGQNAFVSINFVEVTTSGASTGSSATTVTTTTSGTGTISGLDGDRLRCRSAASSSASIITMLAEGSVVTVRGSASNGFVPVVCAGQNGFVSSSYITLGSSSGSSGGNETESDTGTSTGYVKVSGTNGASLNCRSAASTSGMVITAVAAGTTLQTRGATTNGWVPVVCSSRNGYVSASYVSSTTAPGSGSGTGTGTTNPSPTTGTATVTGTDGDGVRCRVEPNGTIITTVAEGTAVGTRGASSNGWTPVVCGNRDGYISSTYLTTGGGTTNPDPTPQPSGLAVGDHAKLTANVNLRYSPGGNVVVVVPAGTVVLIKAGLASGAYQVDWDGLGGYLVQDYLVKTSEALSERGGSGNDPDPSPGGGGTATGNALVNYAMRYVGYPYIWNTHGPSSFDCSGFTFWVTKNVMGRDIGTGLWTQWATGSAVSRSSLQPGDLVFFQNTSRAGLSHVGIYIGNNQFVHAENETTGVRVSDLNSSYYSSRWLGARRLG